MDAESSPLRGGFCFLCSLVGKGQNVLTQVVLKRLQVFMAHPAAFTKQSNNFFNPDDLVEALQSSSNVPTGVFRRRYKLFPLQTEMSELRVLSSFNLRLFKRFLAELKLAV